ncbi:aluminum-activated malate transporter 14-like [Rhododendron vialii]|uniref:aluminum-activated malate transporter 14-like n=1 Tax=Rhododendron vialii TaxID=182163 RepID=UPI00265E4F8D|nr:aluminum-activated malate transporter 14-like [Rhododendron vialii]
MEVAGKQSGGEMGSAAAWWAERARKIGNAVAKEGREDPRKVVHSVKVGMAVTVASMVYLLEPLFHGMGRNNSIWAVLTVILVLEFTAGATLYKGINRGIGTLAALSFALLIEIVARHVGHIGCAISIGFSVFLTGAFMTYMRFIPAMKKHCDNGLIVFLLTFNLITVGSYHDDNVFHSAIQRNYTIAIGCGICIITSLLILPNWSGEDLHSSIISKFEDLAKVIQACVEEYFQVPDTKDASKSSKTTALEKSYEEIFQCNSTEESLATFASWEPRHSRYCYPWKQYVHLGTVLSRLAYTAFVLHGCLESHVQAPQTVRALFKEPCEHVAEEIVKVLSELAETIKKHHHFSAHISDHLHEALEELDASIKTQHQLFLPSNPTKTEAAKPSEILGSQIRGPEQLKIRNRTTSKTVITRLEFSEALPFSAFVSLLIETVAQLDLVIEEVEELAKVAHFKEFHEEDDSIENKVVPVKILRAAKISSY